MPRKGCGKPTHVTGTNGGTLPCGSLLRDLDGSLNPYYCPVCERKAEIEKLLLRDLELTFVFELVTDLVFTIESFGKVYDQVPIYARTTPEQYKDFALRITDTWNRHAVPALAKALGEPAPAPLPYEPPKGA